MPSKRDIWLGHYLDRNNTETFMNATASAKAAGYKAKSETAFTSIGHENLTKLDTRIVKWMDEEGLSEARLKAKLMQLLDAKETKFFQKDGEIITKVDVEAQGVQTRVLDMALKVKGMYAPSKVEGKVEHDHTHNHELTPEMKELLDDAYGQTPSK
jgi:phage terminase small subunit